MIKRFLFILLATVKLSLTVQAGDIVTATVVVSSTSVTNLTGTNAASITVSADTRIWTNSVTSSGTQMLASTNASTASFRLLQHLRAFPFSGVATTATNNGVVLIGAEGAALSVTISNSWATVAYRTNTVGTAIVMRAPRSVESATTRAIGDDRIIDGINNAPTNTVSTSAPAMVNYETLSTQQTVSGNKTHTGATNSFPNLSFGLSTLAVNSAATNFVVDLTGNAYRSITATNHLNFQMTTNRNDSFARNVVLLLLPNGTNRNLTFNSSWNWLSTKPTVLTNGTLGVLSVTAIGGSETNVLAAYSFSQ